MNVKITPFIMFNNNAEEALNFYQSIFKDFLIEKKSYYPLNSQFNGILSSAIIILNGTRIYFSNGGSHFKLNESFSLMIECECQEEIDFYWEKLSQDGKLLPCGWLTDKFGLSWQIVPNKLLNWLNSLSNDQTTEFFNLLLSMNKINFLELEDLYNKLKNN